MRQFNVQNRGLDRVESKVAPNHMMKIPRLHPVLSENAQTLRHFVIVAQDGAGIPGCPEIFRRVKTKRTGCAHCARAPDLSILPAILRSNRLSSVLDYGELVVPG